MKRSIRIATTTVALVPFTAARALAQQPRPRKLRTHSAIGIETTWSAPPCASR